ncbi:putative glycine-rich protein [Candidatus Paraburkholderia calva]|nr:putative glycine-rich protein [Candidatus Paraburkholderia calva]
MKFAVSGLLVASSVALLCGCAAYPDSSGYGGGYPGVYDKPSYGYYGGGPVVQPGVVVNGGYYYGPGPRYWDDGPGWRQPYPGGWHRPPPARGPGVPPPGRGGTPPQAGGGGQLPRAVSGVPPGRPAAPPPSNGGGNRGGGVGGNPQRWHEGPIGN